MRVVMALLGSRGDVQPGLVVAAELQRRGHEIAVLTAPDQTELAARLGFVAVPVGGSTTELLESDLVRDRVRRGSLPSRVRALQELNTVGWDALREALVATVQPEDVIVTGLLGQEVASCVAEAIGAAFTALHWCPVRRAGTVPWVGLQADRDAWQRGVCAIGEQVRWRLTKSRENQQREILGLAPTATDLPTRLAAAGRREIQCYDEELVPGLGQEYGPRRPIVGALRPDDAQRQALGVDEDPGLNAWLDRQDETVYVGFGSMPVADPAALVNGVQAMVRQTGLSVLLAGRFEGLDGIEEQRLRVVGSLDHQSVLPRCVAAVHHGGAGTTAAALRAGIPQLIISWSADQPIWGRLVTRAGIGLAVRRSVLEEGFPLATLEQVLKPGRRARAREIAAEMVPPELSAQRAAEAIELAR